jgi:hypothetical protein
MKRDRETLTIANSFTNNGTGTSTVGVTVLSSAGAAAGTAVAVFTAGGGVYTVSSASGYVVVDGKTLSVGSGAQLLGGEEVSEATGGVVVEGQTIGFTALSTETSGSLTLGSMSNSMTLPGPVMSVSSAASMSAPTTTGSAASSGSASASAAASSAGAVAARVVCSDNGFAAAFGMLLGWLVL